MNEIVLTGNSVTVKGGYISLAGAVKFTAQKMELSTPQEVLSFNKVWRANPPYNSMDYFKAIDYIYSIKSPK